MIDRRVFLIAAVVVVVAAGALFLVLKTRKGRAEKTVQEIAEVSETTQEVVPGETERKAAEEELRAAEIENILDLARYYLEKGEYELARGQLEQVLIRDTQNSEARTLLDEVIQGKKDKERRDERGVCADSPLP